MPEAAKPVAMLGLIERLDHVRAAGLDPARGHRVHQSRLAQLAREAGRTTVQHVAGYERRLTAGLLSKAGRKTSADRPTASPVRKDAPPRRYLQRVAKRVNTTAVGPPILGKQTVNA